MWGVHPPEDVQDALNQLDARKPMLYSELRTIAQGLWDAAFQKGACQGRKEAIESVQDRLRAVAGAAADTDAHNLLLSIADSYDDSRFEYQDPTTTIRARLADKARARIDGRYPN